MPNRRLMDYIMRKDMRRNPYGSRGGYVSSEDPRMMRRRDHGMDERFYMDEARNRNDYAEHRGGQDYRGYSDRGYPMHDMGSQQYGQSGGNYRNDGHYPMSQGKTYFPIEAMGTFNGYWGKPQEDMRGRDMGYDPYYNYPMMDYRGRDMRYDMAGDYGEGLTHQELEKWCKKMMSKLDEREKQMFSKESILQRAKNMGIQFDKFSEMEFYVNTIKNYTDHKKSIGENPEMAVKLARDDFNDEDGEFKGSEWLAVYFDTFVEGED